MPVISSFLGIIIRMYINDHNPPHFHAEYSGEAAVYMIATLSVDEGALPRTVDARVRTWAAMHQVELLANWERLHTGQTPHKIDPLTK